MMAAENSSQEAIVQECMRQLMYALQERATNLARDIHPQRIQALLPNFDDLLMLGIDSPRMVRMSFLLADYYDVQWPSVMFLRSKVNRITLLAAPIVKRVFAAAALYINRGSVRRCIARDDRRALIGLVGEPAYAGIRDAPEIKGLQLIAPIKNFQADLWANQGFELLQASSHSMSAKSSKIAQLILMPNVAKEKTSIANSPSVCDDLVEFIDKLDIFFPEQAWLFGLDMDQVLSA
jgi:Bacterial type III secretion protein (HrpB4)